MPTRKQDSRLVRLDANTLTLDHEVPVTIFANDEVPVQTAAVDELLSMLELAQTVATLKREAPGFLPENAGLLAVALSSDFHKGSGIPIGTSMRTRGFAVPQAIGSDINCGMRLLRTNVDAERLLANKELLARTLRQSFFGGRRNIALTPESREQMMRHGLPGLGLSDQQHGNGGYLTDLHPAFEGYVMGAGGKSYDSHLGSLGGGNHFAEIQQVTAIHDGPAAHAWNIKKGDVVVMIHSGSLGFGHVASAAAREMMEANWPKNVLMPSNRILPLPSGSDAQRTFETLMRNAANFAFANRHYLGEMVMSSMAAAVGVVDSSLVYDAPHNLMWDHPGDVFTHRKGSTPAGGYEDVCQTPWEVWGEPVIVPGSMGASSFLLRGQGNEEAMKSACHGAGRAKSRGEAMRASDAELDQFLRNFTVVTSVDIHRPDLRGRDEIINEWRNRIRQEAPWAYKDIGAVIQTLTDANVAQPVAEFTPLLTVKG